MVSSACRLCAVLLFLLPSLTASHSDGSPSATAQHTEVVPASAPVEGLLKLDVVVTDNAGNPVTGLEQKDFLLLDNGQAAKIISFQALNRISSPPDPAVEIIVVIDELQIPVHLISRERIAVVTFLRQNGGHLAQPVSIYSLVDTGLWLLADPSSDGNALAEEITHNSQLRLIRHSRGSLRGSVPDSLGITDPPGLEFLKALGEIATTARRKPGRKQLLWIGPGWGMGSGTYAEGTSSHESTFYTIRWFSTLLREARIALYSFSVEETGPRAQYYLDYLHGMRSAREANFMGLYRKVLAVQSGGRVLDRSDDLVPQIESCVREASGFYILTFDPSHADHPDEYHDLKVQIGKPDLSARTRTSYYDQPYYSDQPTVAATRVSVEQLDHILAAIQPGDHDADVARQLSGLELTERLSETKLASWKTALRGNKARQALTALADASVFLDPPSAEIPSNAPPDATEQQRMLGLASDYLKAAITKLPNFLATRTAVRYEETPQYYEGDSKSEYQPLHVVEISKEGMLYRNGYEVAGTEKKRNAKQPSLITYGTFGPVLGLVRDAIAVSSDLTWSRWEQGPNGPLAVFRYSVPAYRSLYQVWGCCLPDGDGLGGFEKLAAYHGQITIDPETGAVLRLEAAAGLKGFLPVGRSDVMVSYGPVDIGGNTYIRPIRSVSIMRMRSVTTLTEWDESFKTYGPYATMLNDIAYDNYHVFKAKSRVLPGFNPAPVEKSSPPDSP
jgi:VWFA-related protein